MRSECLAIGRWLGLAVLFTSACAGNQASVTPRVYSVAGGTIERAASAAKGTISFVVAIPVTAAFRRPAFVSPATAGMGISIYRSIGGSPLIIRKVNLKSGAPGCKSSKSSRTCTYNLQLASGKYFVNSSTYDTDGHLLSLGQSIPVAVAASKTTVVPLDLNGIPYSITVTPGSSGIVGSQGDGLTLYGTAPQEIVVNAQDVNGNVIAGSGSPTYKLVLSTGNGWTVQGKPSSTSPNVFTITPPGTSGSGAIIRVIATAPGTACKAATAHCNSSFSVVNHLQTLFVGGSCPSGCTGEVFAYAQPYTGTPTIVANNFGTITAMTTNASGDLFVASCNTSCGTSSSPDAVMVFAPPYNDGPSATIINTITDPTILAVDGAGDVFVMNSLPPSPSCVASVVSCHQVTEYASPYSGAPVATTGQIGGTGESMAVASQGTIAVGLCARVPTLCEDSSLTTFQPPSYASQISLVTGAPSEEFVSLAFDQAGDLFAGTAGVGILEFAPPFSNSQQPLATIATSPGPMVLNAAADLFVGCCAVNTITVLAPPYTGPAIEGCRAGCLTKTTSVLPSELALDGAGNIFIVNTDGSAAMKTPPYTGAATPLATQLRAATALAVSP